MIALLLACLVAGVSSMSTKVPDDACSNMFPAGHGVEPQTSPSPFVVMTHDGPVPKGSLLDGKCHLFCVPRIGTSSHILGK